MKIPNNTRIAGVEHTTVQATQLNDGRSCLRGQIDYGTSEISLDCSEHIGHQSKCQTYLHEVLHGIQKHYHIDLPSDQEEDIIDRFATGLYQVLQDNAGAWFDLAENNK